MDISHSVLLVEPYEGLACLLATVIEKLGLQVTVADTLEDAFRALRERRHSALIVDGEFPSEGIDLLIDAWPGRGEGLVFILGERREAGSDTAGAHVLRLPLDVSSLRSQLLRSEQS